ncbi:hypothetical protein QTI33_08770 [Variovorax sp. J22P271]|uniref:hypothetical protein n=1 Tax=Variovorax davisae TaxID=3053515 RepID=UPI0025765040|nr:hypothetical protein [Variovorax sp. J22P271]MDM0032222.1 hypothetical protein [Variovorax sp. J22P271]
MVAGRLNYALVLFALLALSNSAAAEQSGYIDVRRILRETSGKAAGRDEEGGLSRRRIIEEALTLDTRDVDPKASDAGALRDVHSGRIGFSAERPGWLDADTRGRREEDEKFQQALRTAVRHLAERRSLDFVLDDMLYGSPQNDLTQEVIEEMNKVGY